MSNTQQKINDMEDTLNSILCSVERQQSGATANQSRAINNLENSIEKLRNIIKWK